MFNFGKILGLITIGVGGILALIECDFRKIVAFSTLSQLGLMVFVLSFGEWQLCFFHLVTHAIFKSFLFILVGCRISKGYGNQDRRLIGLNLSSRFLLNIFLGFACLNLRGFPLTIGFLSRDVILESFFSFSIERLMLGFFCLFCCFTVGYRIKIYFFAVDGMKIGNSLTFSFPFGGGLLGLVILFLFLAT